MMNELRTTVQTCNQGATMLNETNDCTVRAIAVATQLPYATVHAELKRRGRKDRRGAHAGIYLGALRHFGFDNHPRTFIPCTPRTIAEQFPKGTFLILVHRHILCMVDGVIHDWAKGRKHRITDVQQVVPVGTPKVEEVSYSKPKVNRKFLDLHAALTYLRAGVTVRDLAVYLGTDGTGARSAIDKLRSRGHLIKNVGPSTFKVVEAHEYWDPTRL